MKRQGRKVDSWQVPHKNRTRYLVRFWFDPMNNMSSIVAVPKPVMENLQKYKKEVMDANPRVKFWKVTADFLGADV